MIADLTGKVAIISGSSRGIGRGCAVEMARAGANITINYFSHPEDGEETASLVRGQGREALVLRADVSDRAAVDHMVEATVKRFGHADIAVCNSYYSKRQSFLEIEVEEIRRTHDVTFWGSFHLAQSAARQMVEQGRGGSILFISSVHSFMAFKTCVPYNSAKAAVDHMARTIANDLTEQRIRVNVIQPGWIDTPGERQFATEEEIQEGARVHPWGRLGNSQEIGKAAVFLCSDDADYINGSTLSVDGAITLPR